MNILYICDEYPPGPSGGVGTAVQLLARQLVKMGHQIVVVGLYSYSYGGLAYEQDQGVEVYRLRYGVNLHLPHFSIWHKVFNRIPGILKQHLNGKKAFANYLAFVNKLIVDKNIQLIELSDWNTFAMRIGFHVQWPKFSVPLVLKSHGSYSYFNLEMSTAGKPFLENIDKALYKRAENLAAVSEYTASVNSKLFHDDRPVKVLYNGIEINTYPLKVREENKVVFSGTLMKKKGVFELMQAWNLVQKKRPEARLHIFGKGSTSGLVHLLDGNVKGTVIFHGHVNRELLIKELCSATLAVFPSFSETFGLAVVEAMSVGCPVIYTSKSCGPEILKDGLEGELVDPSNIEQIAAAILKLLGNKALRNYYSENALKRVQNTFDIKVVAQEHLTYYQTVINNERLSGHE